MEENKQTLKETFCKWRDAVDAHKGGSFARAIDIYMEIKDVSARMLYNMACAHIKLHQHARAIEHLSMAVKTDEHLAIAFYQRGLLNLKNKSTKAALHDLETTRTLLRGNTCIDYKPLGMLCKIYLCEVLYNMALAHLHGNHVTEAVRLLTEALHDTDDRQKKLLMSTLETIQDKKLDLLAPVYISIDNVFTPPKSITSNLEKKTLVGKAKVVSASDTNDKDATFNGMKRVQEIKSSQQNSPKSPPPKTPLMMVRNFFGTKQGENSAPFLKVNNNVMRESRSTGDLPSVATAKGADGDHSTKTSFYTNTTSDEDIQYKTSVGTKQRASLGTLFGNSSTALSQALSTSCDVLTAFVAPPNDNNTNGYCPIDVREKIGKLDKNKNLQYPIVKTTATTLKIQRNFNDKSNVEINNNDQVCVNDTRRDKDNEDNTKRAEFRSNDVKRNRPPPPSYPPPPLPPKIVITL